MRGSIVVGVAAALLISCAPGSAEAFCGFYVSSADGKLVADASQVVLMREGTRTVLSMQNDYKGPPQDFAMVVPVPVVLQKENVRTLPRAVFAHVDTLSAPRLVELWEQDPCPPPRDGNLHLGGLGALGGAGGSGLQSVGAGAARESVKIEARFEVGEYEILILSAEDSAAHRTARAGVPGFVDPADCQPGIRFVPPRGARRAELFRSLDEALKR